MGHCSKLINWFFACNGSVRPGGSSSVDSPSRARRRDHPAESGSNRRLQSDFEAARFIAQIQARGGVTLDPEHVRSVVLQRLTEILP